MIEPNKLNIDVSSEHQIFEPVRASMFAQEVAAVEAQKPSTALYHKASSVEIANPDEVVSYADIY